MLGNGPWSDNGQSVQATDAKAGFVRQVPSRTGSRRWAPIRPLAARLDAVKDGGR